MTDEEKPEPDKKPDRVNMNWPVGLKDQVQELVGARGVTKFAVEAVQTRLSGEDTAQVLTKEVDELRYFTQLVLDRYVMGGEADDRHAFLMELDLPAWVRTDGWPTELAKLVPVLDPVSEPVLTEEQRRPTQPPAPITGLPAMAVTEPAHEVKPYTDEELNAPSYAVAARQAGKSPMPASPEVLEQLGGFEPHAFVRSAEGSGKVCMAEGCIEGPGHDIHAVQTPVETPAAAPLGRDNPSYAAPSDDFLARVQAVAAKKGIDVSGAGLMPASRVAAPTKPAVHNHAWTKDDGGTLHCDCGAIIDMNDPDYPQGIVRDAKRPEPATEPAPALEVQPDAPTSPATLAGQPNPFAAPGASGPDPFPQAPTRSLDDFDVDF